MRKILKIGAVCFALTAGFLAGAIFIPGQSNALPKGEPLSPLFALTIVELATAVTLVRIGTASRLRGWRLAFFLGAVMFTVQQLLMQAETLYFIRYVRVPPTVIATSVFAGAISCTWGSLVAASLTREATPRAGEAELMFTPGRAVSATILYVVLYFAAGHLIAWRFAAVRQYYGDAVDIATIPLALFQLARGMVWAIITYVLANYLTGTRAWRAATVALSLVVFGDAQLLIPNPYMPWPVRMGHLTEVGISSLLFGFAATFIFARAGKRTNFTLVRGAIPD